MMKKIYTLGLVSLSLFLGASCSKNADTEPSNSQTSEQKLPEYTASINLSATFSSGAESMRAYLTPTADGEIAITFKDEELMKDGVGVDASGNPNRVLGSETGKLTFFFVKKSNLTTVVGPVVVSPTDFRKVGDKYVISYHGTVTASGLDLSSGEWYVSGGYRLDDNATGNITGFTYLDATGKLHSTRGDQTNFKLPFVFGWTKLATKLDNASFANNHGQSFSLNMIPDGHFMRIRAINNLVEDINLTFLGVRSEVMSVFGDDATAFAYAPLTLNSASDLIADNTPRIKATLQKDVRLSRYGLGPDKLSPVQDTEGSGLILTPGDYYTLYQRINSPSNSNNIVEEGGMVFSFLTKDRAFGTDVSGNQLDSKEIAGLTSTTPTFTWPQSGAVLTDNWRGASMQETHGNSGGVSYMDRSYRNRVLPANTTFEQGKVNNINFKINSDLMITELYTTRYADRNGSYGLIEIYNPTLDEIDLSKYGLVRIGYRNDGGTNRIRVVPTSVEVDQSTNNSGETLMAKISEALVLPLDMNSGNPTGKWANNSFGRNVRQPAVVPGQYRYGIALQYNDSNVSVVTYSGFPATIVDFSTKGLITGLQAITPGSTKLAPGKTMIILFSGFASSTYSPSDADRAIFNRIQEAVNSGYCQYVVAISQGTATSAPNTTTAGVTTADLGDSFSLIKIANVPVDLASAGAPFEPASYRVRAERKIFVDGTWTPFKFDAGTVVGNLMNTNGVNAILRRPYGPYLWNKGFLPPSDMSSYYQVAYTGASQATFGAPYFSSYEAGKNWSSVVAPKVAQRDAALFKSK